ncbi:hypothetical protein PW5551_08840 [Petrotoga sp. 9PW.55.5.1]|uniref:GGDEF domain-containing protein n=1 Tax=Petrotoga sp. 9PW.55.5.1 TaxID=1308979 RepID=UPI000DC32E03|nr:GGDEF domain-containing protein [Petrotoga sp. 9PW.55.5.1]RAO98580.1 hypothetical protein PW5551_08840 [Petrotoga sp. 9PW.55.5.1]
MDNIIPEKYIKNIKISYLNPGITFLVKNLTKEILLEFWVDIRIHEDPNEVPETFYKFLKVCNSFSVFVIKSVEEVDKSVEQRIKIKLSDYNDEFVIIDYEILKKNETDFIFEIIKKANPLIGLILVDILINSSKLASVFNTSKELIKRGYNPDSTIDEMVFASMVGITGGFSGAFNRSILYVESNDHFEVLRALGPGNAKEAHQIYEAFETLEDNIEPYLERYDNGVKYFSNLEKYLKMYTLDKKVILNNGLFLQAIQENKTIKVPVSRIDNEIVNLLDLRGEIAFSPFYTEKDHLAFFICDNRYTMRSITDEQLDILDYYAKECVMMWQNKLFQNTLKRDAEIDSLTKIGNRRAYEKYVSSLKYTKNKEISIAIFDLDDFKNINDKYGHSQGDIVLKEFSETLKLSMRDSDKIFRYGGDEFVAFINEIDKEKVYSILKRVNLNWKKKNKHTFSVGVARGNSNQIDTLFEKADENLYKAKKLGKNRIVID